MTSNSQPPSEKVHQIIARTALFVSQHGGQTEIVLRVKQGSNPTFGFLMPDHYLHSYFRYLVDHPQLLKDSTDAGDTKGCKTVNSESGHANSSGGALSLLGAIYESGDEDEDIIPCSSSIDPGNDVGHKQGHENPAFVVHDNKELKKGVRVTTPADTAVKDKPIFTKKNPMFTANNHIVARQEKPKDSMAVSTTSRSQHSKLGVSDTKEAILEPPSFLKPTMEKIVEFIIRNGKEFEEKLIEQDRATGRFPFLLPSNPYHSYYLKILQETQESKSRGGSSEHKDRSSSGCKDRTSTERKDRNSSGRKGSSHSKEGAKTKVRASTNKDFSASDSSSEELSEKQLYDKQQKGRFQMVIGVAKKEHPRKVTADEAAAIVMAATRGLGPTIASSNTPKDTRDFGHTRGNNGHSSSFGSLSSLQDPEAASKPASNSETGTSLTSSGQLKRDGAGIDDHWIANTIAKAAAVAASKEADSSEASTTKEQKLKAERLRRAKMFAAIIKSEGNKVTGDPTNEPANATHADLNFSGPDPRPLVTESEDISVPFEREGSNLIKQEKDTDDEQNRVRKYRKKRHSESDEEEEDVKERYKHSRKKHRSEHSRSHNEDVHRHKYKRHSKDQESRHHRHHHSSSEDEREHKSFKSRYRHRNDDDYPESDEHRSHRHRRDHRSFSRRKHEDDRDHGQQTLGLPEASQSTSGNKLQPEKPLSDTAQSSQAASEVPNELRAKIRAMLLETL